MGVVCLWIHFNVFVHSYSRLRLRFSAFQMERTNFLTFQCVPLVPARMLQNVGDPFNRVAPRPSVFASCYRTFPVPARVRAKPYIPTTLSSSAKTKTPSSSSSFWFFFLSRCSLAPCVLTYTPQFNKTLYITTYAAHSTARACFPLFNQNIKKFPVDITSAKCVCCWLPGFPWPGPCS